MPKTPRLREWRERATLSQEELKKRSGISRATIADLEAGNRGAQPRTVRRLAAALGVEPTDLYGDPDSPKAGAPPSQRSLFNGGEEERRLGYLRAWRAFVYKLLKRWEQDPPKSSREIAVVLDTMQALLEEGAFERPPEQITTSDKREASEWLDLSFLFRGIDRLNQIADGVQEDAEAERRRSTFRKIEGQMAG
jgi:transcriptional regulator with XRE-family HTH domain